MYTDQMTYRLSVNMLLERLRDHNLTFSRQIMACFVFCAFFHILLGAALSRAEDKVSNKLHFFPCGSFRVRRESSQCVH